MSAGYRVTIGSTTRTFTSDKRDAAVIFAGGDESLLEDITVEENDYDPAAAAQASISKGREIAEYMLVELNTRAKAYKQATGIAIGSGLIDLNSKLENYLIKGALEPDAINEIQRIVNTGQVDNLLDLYADALVRIDNFLGGV